MSQFFVGLFSKTAISFKNFFTKFVYSIFLKYELMPLKYHIFETHFLPMLVPPTALKIDNNSIFGGFLLHNRNVLKAWLIFFSIQALYI